MKSSFLRLWVLLRRFRRSRRRPGEAGVQQAGELEALARRADPGASWQSRCAWIIELAAWLRADASMSGNPARLRMKRPLRVNFFLRWMDDHPAEGLAVQAVLRTTLQEALGPDLFCATGLQRAPALVGELGARLFGRLLPVPPPPGDLSALFAAIFPQAGDADWLLAIDSRTAAQLWRLAGDAPLTQAWRVQIDDAMRHLAIAVLATGIGPGFRQRMPRSASLQESPFLQLRDAVEACLQAAPGDRAALGWVRRQVAACRAQSDAIYAHLDEHGVSVSLVYQVEGLRAQLARILRLAELRASSLPGQAQGMMVALLAELVHAQHERRSVRGLLRRNFSLLARKLVERNADHGEHYIARDRAQYIAMLRAAGIGGIITAFVLLGKNALAGLGLPRFFEGLFISLDFAAGFLLIAALGGVLATKQPAVTAPALAARMVALDTLDGLRSLLHEITCLLRSQAAAVMGNLAAVAPTMLLLALAVHLSWDASLMTPAKARDTIASLSLLGPTPLYAAFTGVLLWLASLAAGLADNAFALRHVRAALACQRRLVATIGPVRAARFAAWVEHHVATVAGNVALAFLLGMTPAVAGFFGLPLDTRHVTLSTGAFTAAASTLGWEIFSTPAPWLAMAGLLLIGLLNVGVAFGCALALALQARAVSRRVKRIVFRSVLKRFAARPLGFLFGFPPSAPEPGQPGAREASRAAAEGEADAAPQGAPAQERRRRRRP